MPNNREPRTYLDYLKEVSLGMLTAWKRIANELDDLRAGLYSLIATLFLLVMPLLVVFAPLFALLAIASDKKDAERAVVARKEMQERADNVWGSDSSAKSAQAETLNQVVPPASSRS